MNERHGERLDTPETEPAPTITSKARTASWVYRNGNQERAAERPVDTPAPTVHFGHALNDVSWVERRPAPTVVTTRRSKDGLLVGRQMAEGEGENVGGWGWERPSTAVCADPRISPPGYRAEGNYKGERSMDNAVRVTLQEAAILQGFPPDYPFQGSRTKQFEQVGNAVPPPLARAIIAALLDVQEERKVA